MLAATSVSVAVVAWVDGVAFGAITFAAAIAFVVARLRRHSFQPIRSSRGRA
jgi:hypothetical protein